MYKQLYEKKYKECLLITSVPASGHNDVSPSVVLGQYGGQGNGGGASQELPAHGGEEIAGT